MKILILGSSGMLGSGITFQLSKNPLLQVVRVSRGRDNPDFVIREVAEIENLISFIKPEVIINCIGIIKPQINQSDSSSIYKAISINAVFPHELLKWSQDFGIKLIQIATDCVYDGKSGNYSETDSPCPIDVYGMTKSLGEVSSSSSLNLRCSIIGPSRYHKDSLYEWVVNSPKNSQISGFTNHFWNGISTLAFAQIIERILFMNESLAGTFHIVPANSLSKFELISHITKVSGRNDLTISEEEAETRIDRTLVTNHEKINLKLWGVSTMSEIPSIQDLPILY